MNHLLSYLIIFAGCYFLSTATHSWESDVCIPKSVSCLPAGGLISGGGIMGTMMGGLPCSLVLSVELDAEVRGSVIPFLEAGKDRELLARSGEVSPLSVNGGILGNKFSK